jgi:hypothetical protein
MSERFWIHCNPAGDGSQVFEILSEDHTGEPLAIGEPGEEAAAVGLLVQSGVSKEASAAAVTEARRAGIASVETDVPKTDPAR